MLVVKLADLGDLLTATPAMRALRRRFPTTEITALVTPHSAPLLAHNDALDRIMTFPKALFDQPRRLLHPSSAVRAAAQIIQLTARLRAARFDTVILLHHLTTRGGTAKYRALIGATGAPVVAGLDNGRGSFLTQRVADLGFGGRHEVEYWLEVARSVGANPHDEPLELHFTEAERAQAANEWRLHGLGARVAAIHPGSGRFSIARRWPAERFASVADALARDGLQIAIVAGPEDGDTVSAMQHAMHAAVSAIIDVPSPRRLASMLQQAVLFVGNDSGVMHMAAAVGVPVVAVFGLSNDRAWGPYPLSAHRVVRLDLPCSPCLYVGHELGTPAGCPARTCLVDLPPAAVIQAAHQLIPDSPGPRSAIPLASTS